MPQERFEQDVHAPVSPDELRLVLHDLSQNEVEERRAKHDLPPDHVTAQAISETLDVPLEEVYEAISRVRRHDVRQHVSRVLNELEEPTHLVERPGHGNDPLIHNYNYRRENVFSSVLDKLPRPERKNTADETPPRSVSNMEKLLVFAVSGGLIGALVYLAAQIVQR